MEEIRKAFTDTIQANKGNFEIIHELESVGYGEKAISISMLTGRDFRNSLTAVNQSGICQVNVLVPKPNNNDGEPDYGACIAELEAKALELMGAVIENNKKYLDEATVPYLSQVIPCNESHYAIVLSITYEYKRR